MHDIGEGTIRRIDWTELTPVVLLLRVFNISLGLRILALALIGWCLTAFLYTVMDVPPTWNAEVSLGMVWSKTTENPNTLGEALGYTIPVVFPNLVFSFWENSKFFTWFPGIVLIWAFCGGLICRIVAVRLTIDESESTSNLVLFFRKRGIGFISSIVLLSLGILCSYFPVKITAWMATVPGLNYVVAILFPIPLLFAFLTVILALGLIAGFMLLFAAVSVDGSDGFDAISRMFSYIFQRPLHYLLYWLCSGILGCFGFLLLDIICCPLVWLTQEIILGIPPNSIVGMPVGLSILLIMSLPVAYLFAWFWTSSVAIYLLLRRSVDATPFNEIYRVSPPKVRSLPTIKQDEQGAPEIERPE